MIGEFLLRYRNKKLQLIKNKNEYLLQSSQMNNNNNNEESNPQVIVTFD